MRLRLTLQSGLFLALFLTLVMLLAFVARDYRKEWDVTRNARNTLSAQTLDVLGRLDGPLAVTAYAVSQDASGGNVHKNIEERLRPYRRAKPDLDEAVRTLRRAARLARTDRAGHLSNLGAALQSRDRKSTRLNSSH